MSSYSSAFVKDGVTVVCCDKCDAPDAHYIAVIDGWFCDSCSIQIGEDFMEDEEEDLENCPPCNNNGNAKAFYKP